MADKLANYGRKAEFLETPIEVKDMCKFVEKMAQIKWQEKWNIDRQRWLFGIMKEKLEEWYWTRNKKRRVDVILTRMRLRCVNLNKYLYKINVSETDLCTKCNLQQQEDVDHYLLGCIAFKNQRDTMINNLRHIGVNTISTNILLGSSDYEKGVKIIINREVAKYIKTTERFD